MALADTLTASVDRSQLGKGETLELLVQYDGQTTSDPDFTPLNDDFEVLSQQQKNKFSIMNGNSTSYTEWRLQLLPRKTGKLQIPSLSFKGVDSKAIMLKVEDRPQTSTS
ncbi:MAG: BatD family protein, partial [Porticoccus sp.]